MIPDRRLGPEPFGRVLRTLAVAGLIDTLTALDPIGRPLWFAPDGERPPGDRSPPGPPGPLRGGPGFGGPPRGPPPGGPPAELRAGRLELLGHHAVIRGNDAWGDLALLGPARTNLWSLPESRGLELFLPLAVLTAGGAGLIMARILARRLRALEAVAGRVIAGDLAARVEEHGSDEVGRLEERFNEMTGRLAAAHAEVEHTERQRRQLFAGISHELATPLTSIRGYVETLLDPKVTTTPEERASYLADVLDESKRLDLLISDLLDLARLESESRPLKRVRLDWKALCANAARRLAPQFEGAGLRLEWAESADAAWIEADGRRLEQVVDNLLLNALRYVPSGGTVSLALAPCAERRFRLTVSDDGPGIPAADLPHVFERFYRAESVRAQGGTGLGLAIVRAIVHQHGGQVRAEQRHPQGAVFVVELPAAE